MNQNENTLFTLTFRLSLILFVPIEYSIGPTYSRFYILQSFWKTVIFLPRKQCLVMAKDGRKQS